MRWWFAIVGLALDILGGAFVVWATYTTPREALEIGVSMFAAESDEENLDLPAVQNLLAQNRAQLIGFSLVAFGFGLQLVSLLLEPTHGAREEPMESAPERPARRAGTDLLSAEQKWTGVPLAYEFVAPSYQLMVNRYEAADTRLTMILTLASTLTTAIPLFARNVQPGISFRSSWFLAAMMCFVLGAGIAIGGRLFLGGIMLPDPMVLYRKALRDSPWEFKKNAIYFAGQHFQHNSATVRRKSFYAAYAAGLLVLEIGLVAAWLYFA